MSSAPDVEWDEQEQGWMLALAMWRATRCPLCGRDLDECASADADGRFTAGLPTRCHATTALLVAQKAYLDIPQADALLWRAEKR